MMKEVERLINIQPTWANFHRYYWSIIFLCESRNENRKKGEGKKRRNENREHYEKIGWKKKRKMLCDDDKLMQIGVWEE